MCRRIVQPQWLCAVPCYTSVTCSPSSGSSASEWSCASSNNDPIDVRFPGSLRLSRRDRDVLIGGVTLFGDALAVVSGRYNDVRLPLRLPAVPDDCELHRELASVEGVWRGGVGPCVAAGVCRPEVATAPSVLFTTILLRRPPDAVLPSRMCR
eukprot:m.1110584 g.1110584  ORF g.1110584 m.1110584 type:complete len:153 (+) comp24358_c0_seq1:218-676(+)